MIEDFREFERKAVDLINGLGIKGLRVQCLNLLPASYVNLEYGLENGGRSASFVMARWCWGSKSKGRIATAATGSS